jgi:HlyD family secretion protein
MKWIKRILSAALAVALLALLGWSFMPRPVEVETAQVTKGRFVQTIDEDGRTRVRDRCVVSAPLVGRLQRISLQEGDPVQKDAVLATIAPTAPALLDARTEQELTARVGAAEAGKLRASVRVERAQVALAQAQADFERTGKLASAAFVSPTKLEADRLNVALNEKEVEAAKQEVHVAEHDLEVARAALVQMRSPPPAAPGKLWQVRAPVTGRVLKVVQKNEGVVNLGTPLLELGNARELEAVVDVLTSDAVRIRPGAQVLFERWGGAGTLEGRVRLVEPSAFTKISALGVEEQRVNVVIDIVSPPDKWQAMGDGYRVEARIVIDQRQDATLVPVSALFRDGEQWAVFALAQGRAAKRSVQLGPRSGLVAVVDKGLQAGEPIIIYPGDAVKDQEKVKVRNTSAISQNNNAR